MNRPGVANPFDDLVMSGVGDLKLSIQQSSNQQQAKPVQSQPAYKSGLLDTLDPFSSMTQPNRQPVVQPTVNSTSSVAASNAAYRSGPQMGNADMNIFASSSTSMSQPSSFPATSSFNTPANNNFQQSNMFTGFSQPNTQPTNNFIQPTNNFIQPTNNFIQPTNNFIQPTNNFIQPTNNFIQPTSTFIQPTNNNNLMGGMFPTQPAVTISSTASAGVRYPSGTSNLPPATSTNQLSSDDFNLFMSGSSSTTTTTSQSKQTQPSSGVDLFGVPIQTATTAAASNNNNGWPVKQQQQSSSQQQQADDGFGSFGQSFDFGGSKNGPSKKSDGFDDGFMAAGSTTSTSTSQKKTEARPVAVATNRSEDAVKQPQAKPAQEQVQPTSPPIVPPIGDPNATIEGKCLTRLSMISLLVKEWNQTYWVIANDVLSLYKNKEDYIHNPPGTNVVKIVPIKHNLQLSPLKFKEYSGYGYLHHFTLDEVSEIGPTLIAKFGSIDRLQADFLFAELTARIQRKKMDRATRTVTSGDNNSQVSSGSFAHSSASRNGGSSQAAAATRQQYDDDDLDFSKRERRWGTLG